MKYLAVGEFFMNISKAMLLLSFAKFMYDQTGEIWAISFAFIGEVVSSSLLPLMIGRTIDRSGVSGILTGSVIAHIVFCILGALLINTLGMSNGLLLSISILLSFAWPVSRIAVFTATPLLSEQDKLENHNGLLTFALQGGQLGGMALAGLLLSNFDFPVILYVAASFFTISLVFYFLCTRGLPVHNEETHAATTHSLPVLDVFRASRPFFPLFLLSHFDFAAVAIFNILLAAIVAIDFAGNPYWLAGLDAAYAIGALAGGILVAQSIRKKTSNINDAILIQIAFVIYLILSLMSDMSYLMPVAVVFIGLYQSYAGIYWRTRLQRQLPAELFGQLTGIKFVVSSVYIGLTTLIISWAHEQGFDVAIWLSVTLTLVQIAVLIMAKNYEPVTPKAISDT